MKRTFLARLDIEGESLPTASLIFERGLNVVSGKENRGKSFAFSCIDFAFGGKTPPDPNPHTRAYQFITLYSATSENTRNAIRRQLDGSSIHCLPEHSTDLDVPFDDWEKLAKSTTAKGPNVSRYWLELFGFSAETKLRSNASGGTRSLTIRQLSHLFLVDELRIMAKRSPARQTQVTSWTADANLFAMAIGGRSESPTDARTKVATVEGMPEPLRQYLKTEIDSLQRKLEDSVDAASFDDFDNAFKIQAEGLRASADSAAKELQKTLSLIQSSHSNYSLALEQSKNSREMLFRLNLLQQHYRSDLKRLEAVNETAFLVAQLSPVPCPICRQAIEKLEGDKVSDWTQEDVSKVCIAAKAELRRIQLLEADLEKVIDRTGEEVEANTLRETKLKEVIASLQLNADQQKQQASKVREQFDSAFKNLSEIAERRSLANRMQELISQLGDRDETELAIEQKPLAEVAPPIDPEAIARFCEEVRKLLVAWKWDYTPEPIEVSFDETSTSIVVSDETHRSFGKAARALISSAFVVGLMNFCFENDLPHPGFVVLDSPLTTKKGEASDNKPLSDGILFAFFNQLSSYADRQVIIFDNKEPSAEISSKINHVRFGDLTTDTQKGLIP